VWHYILFLYLVKCQSATVSIVSFYEQQTCFIYFYVAVINMLCSLHLFEQHLALACAYNSSVTKSLTIRHLLREMILLQYCSRNITKLFHDNAYAIDCDRNYMHISFYTVVATDRITIAAQIDPSYSPGVANVHL